MPVVVLADVSGSMDGEKIAVLNRSIKTMFAAFAAEDSIRGEIHTAVVAFGGTEATVHQPMQSATQASWADLAPSGRTPLGNAFAVTRALLENAEAVPERAFPPTLILVSDGVPTDDWESPLNELLASRRGGQALRLAIGIGADRTTEADEVLTAFSTPGVSLLRTDQVHELTRMFHWVTATVTGTLQARTGQQAIRLADLD